MAEKYPKEFLDRLKAVTGKRPKTVIDHILAHGHVTTEELREIYNYDHPPRAVKDVSDLGIPIERFKAKGKHGRTIAAYRFGDPSAARGTTHAGRIIFSKAFKKALLARDSSKCSACSTEYSPALLQIDHRIPYEVGGQTPGKPNEDDYMLLCRPCSRAKSWECEHCQNGKVDKKPEVCQTCFWASPLSYEHIAMRQIRRLELVWTEGEVKEHDELLRIAKDADAEMPEYVKEVIRKHVLE
jgi:hypothetical protein